MTELPTTADEGEPFALGTGLDLETPAAQRNPGGCIGSENYEPKPEGGYERLGGAERFDGSPAPSATVFVALRPQSTFEAMAVGAVVTGSPSGATGTVVYATADLLALAAVTGTFVTGDSLTVSGSPVGVAVADPQVLAADLNELQAAAEDWRRPSIGAVPGQASTPIRGLEILEGVVYAWRDHDGSSQKVWKSTPTGWQEVPLLQRIAYTNGTAVYAEGSTLSRGGVTATVRRAVVQAGNPDDWAASPTSGWLIISDASGAFTAGAATGGGACTLSGEQSQIVLNPGGKWVLKAHNFYGGAATLRLYGADGVNDLIEFDGTVLAPIPVSMPVKPHTLELHKGHLFAAFSTSVQRSGIQEPYQWTAVTGSAELMMGDQITDLVSVSGSATEAALLVLGVNKSAVIYGDSADFRIDTLSTEVGARPYTAQVVGKIIALDDNGMRDFTPTQAFGNFRSLTITNHIRRRVVGLSPRASVVVRNTGRYRLFLADGRVLSGAHQAKNRWAWAFGRYPFAVNVACEGEIAGLSRVFVGCDDGYVRELDVGRSHDGEPVGHFIKLPFSSLGLPGWVKKVARAELEVSSNSFGRLSYHIEPDYADPNRIGSRGTSADVPHPGTLWDIDAWDTGVWDGKAGQTLRLRARCTGENFSMTFHGESRSELPHELHSLRMVWRRLRRQR